MSVLKINRSESKAEFINTANEIYTRTMSFLSRLSARYSRLLVPPGKDPNEILDKVIAKATECGFTINRAKTQISPLTRPFKYCKAKYTLTATGRVYVHGNRDSVKRDRRKMKAFKRMYDEGKMKLEDIRTGAQGAIAYFDNYDDHNRVLKLRRLFYALFGFSVENNANFKEDREQCDMWFTDDYAGPA